MIRIYIKTYTRDNSSIISEKYRKYQIVKQHHVILKGIGITLIPTKPKTKLLTVKHGTSFQIDFYVQYLFIQDAILRCNLGKLPLTAVVRGFVSRANN